MEVKATIHYLHMSPRKVRLVASLIRGMELRQADLHLDHLPKRAALPLLKLLRSAAANAKNNFELAETNLYVKEIRVDEGPMLKRMRPRAMGRGATIRKRMSHVLLTLATRGVTETKKIGKQKAEEMRLREVLPEEARPQGTIKAKIKEEFNKKPIREGKPQNAIRRMFRRKSI